MQMIASRTGGCANPALADLLARMRSGDSGSTLNVEDLLAQQAQTNPMAAMLAKQIAEQKAMRAAQESSPVIDVEASAETGADGTVENGGQGHEAAVALCELRENMKGMLVELELLREIETMRWPVRLWGPVACAGDKTWNAAVAAEEADRDSVCPMSRYLKNLCSRPFARCERKGRKTRVIRRKCKQV